MTAKLNVNIDHVATIREARKTIEPSVVDAALICEQAGADGITVHLRGDRRHIQDRDIEQLREIVTTYLNVEMAATDEMVGIAIKTKPDAVSLVPESPNEVTTEGGLDVIGNFDNVRSATEKLKAAGILVSIFIDPDIEQIDAAKKAGAQQVELCTAEYAELTLVASDTMSEPGAIATGFPNGEGAQKAGSELSRIAAAAVHAHKVGLKVAAGHGLTTRNVAALAAIPEITEFNIGHHIISRSVFIGLNQAVKEMIAAIS
ncbi:MAG: pyridoxine 5'-phosphate synthase [Chloracidobacterium sp.]|nr:pyridoxine 5'-phosphate synthase [Chloracidobacterium sp.]